MIFPMVTTLKMVVCGGREECRKRLLDYVVAAATLGFVVAAKGHSGLLA